MARNVKKKGRCDRATAAVDRISNLPSNLIDLILRRLLIRDAARMSVLSKAWRGIWLMHPHLIFDEEFFTQVFSDNDPEAHLSEVIRTISNILLLHRGPIITFFLSIPENLSLNLGPDMGFWMSNISYNGVKILEILNKKAVMCRMPSSFFSCVDLTFLSLDNCILCPPLGFGGFCNLIDVRLVSVIITADLSFGTRLERIVLDECTGIQHLGSLFKDNNNLVKLTIFDSGEFNWELFQSIQKPQLLGLVLNDVMLNSIDEFINLDKLVGSMPRINFLSLDALFLESLQPGAAVLKRLITTLKDLHLECVEFGNLIQMQYALCLMKSSPNLRYLTIQLEPKVNSSNYVDLTELWVDIILDQLETVEIKGIIGSRAEFQFVRLLLASTASLRWINLEKDSTVDDPKEELRISRELLQFPRASPAARISWT